MSRECAIRKSGIFARSRKNSVLMANSNASSKKAKTLADSYYELFLDLVEGIVPQYRRNSTITS